MNTGYRTVQATRACSSDAQTRLLPHKDLVTQPGSRPGTPCPVLPLAPGGPDLPGPGPDLALHAQTSRCGPQSIQGRVAATFHWALRPSSQLGLVKSFKA